MLVDGQPTNDDYVGSSYVGYDDGGDLYQLRHEPHRPRRAGDRPEQGTTPSALLWDVVLSGQAERYRLRYALGLYNAMNYRYTVPVSREFQQESIVQSGRTALLSAQVTF